MKTKLLASIVLSTVIGTIAQAQNFTYSRVKVVLDAAHSLRQLSAAGIAVDHGTIIKDKSYTSDLNQQEINTLKKLGCTYYVEIADVQHFYEHQNDNLSTTKLAANTACNTKNKKQYTIPTNFKLGTMGGYFTYTEMLSHLDSMHIKYPNLIKARAAIDTFKTYEQRPVYWLKISDNPNVDEAEPEILYTSVHHAREPNSLSQQIMYMWYLLENYATNPEIKYLVDNTELYFIPCVNPDGYIYNTTTNPNGGGMWRKNRRVVTPAQVWGVDLNRNYGDNWGFDDVGSSPDSTSDTYRGKAGFSEPETKAVKWLCEQHQFEIALNYHTYGNLLIYPWGYLADLYTPDSAQFVQYAQFLTEDNKFKYGTGNQTVNYTTNGDSDDWMYGEQTSKPKILSLTPEAGDGVDGFWPAQNKIKDICVSNLTQNLNALRLLSKYYRIAPKTSSIQVNNSSNFYFAYNITRLGMRAGPQAIVTISPLQNVVSTGTSKVYNNMTLLQSIDDSIAFTANVNIALGQKIKLLLSVNNGDITTTDTITIGVNDVAVPQVTILYDSANVLTPKWLISAGSSWGTTTAEFVSPSKSITDSPIGNYDANNTRYLTLVNTVNFSGNVTNATLSYYAKWEIENDYDYAVIQASTNGTNWTNLCGNYTQATAGGVGYDDVQANWVKEEINLANYVGKPNVKFRFKLFADQGVQLDGFYFDDFEITTQNATTGINQLATNNVGAYPNPFTTTLNIVCNEPSICTVYNAQGQVMYTKTISATSLVNTDMWSNGLYVIAMQNIYNGTVSTSKIIKQ
jgi:carboxypeptidase T